MQQQPLGRRFTFERAYSVLVAVKGLNGLLEFAAGLLLILAPSRIAVALAAVAAELAEGTSPIRDAAARAVGAAFGGVVTGALPLALFFLVHGVVKLLTVYALLRRAIRWYPLAIVALTALLGVQIADLVATPSIGGWVLTILDVLILALVAWEYRRLRRGGSSTGAAPMALGAARVVASAPPR